ncbi:MAG: hypothetical protein ACE5FO_10180 [Parvularculaceae bacterium]
MQLRRSLAFGLFFFLGLFASIEIRAQEFAAPQNAAFADMRWEALSEDERAIVDRLAADFFEDSLRYSQASAIEARTAELYAESPDDARAEFRITRREKWRAMNDAQRRALRGVERPRFANLSEGQKMPFRKYALDRLDAAGAIDRTALVEALRNDI